MALLQGDVEHARAQVRLVVEVEGRLQVDRAALVVGGRCGEVLVCAGQEAERLRVDVPLVAEHLETLVRPRNRSTAGEREALELAKS